MHSVNLFLYMVFSEQHYTIARVSDAMMTTTEGLPAFTKLAIYLGRTLKFSASTYLCQEEETGYRGRPHSGDIGKQERRSFLTD